MHFPFIALGGRKLYMDIVGQSCFTGLELCTCIFVVRRIRLASMLQRSIDVWKEYQPLFNRTPSAKSADTKHPHRSRKGKGRGLGVQF